jgi:hypothetical protein
MVPMIWRIENFDAITKTKEQCLIHLGCIPGPYKLQHDVFNAKEVDTLLELWRGVDAVDGCQVGKSATNPSGRFKLRAICVATVQDNVAVKEDHLINGGSGNSYWACAYGHMRGTRNQCLNKMYYAPTALCELRTPQSLQECWDNVNEPWQRFVDHTVNAINSPTELRKRKREACKGVSGQSEFARLPYVTNVCQLIMPDAFHCAAGTMRDMFSLLCGYRLSSVDLYATSKTADWVLSPVNLQKLRNAYISCPVWSHTNDRVSPFTHLSQLTSMQVIDKHIVDVMIFCRELY